MLGVKTCVLCGADVGCVRAGVDHKVKTLGNRVEDEGIKMQMEVCSHVFECMRQCPIYNRCALAWY